MNESQQQISEKLRDHYQGTFLKHGRCSEGVDWGSNEEATQLRYEKFRDLIDVTPSSVLDVGCGYAAFRDKYPDLDIRYTGVDMVEPMLASARERHPDASFIQGNFLEVADQIEPQDYVFCNGILTQKLEASHIAMSNFAYSLIECMFAKARIGIAFNLMTNRVNYFSDNLFYKSPSELVAWITNHLTRSFKIDHAYKLREYTIYLYKEED